LDTIWSNEVIFRGIRTTKAVRISKTTYIRVEEIRRGMLEYKGLQISWLGHAGFRITGAGHELVFDPYSVKTRAQRPASIIFITHDHFDHLSPQDIAKFSSRQKTVIVASKNCMKGLKDIQHKEYVLVKPGDEGAVSEVKYRVVPAYNINKFRAPGVVYHPPEYGGVGYVVEIAGTRVYHAGDTDFIPEMKNLGSIDVALLPVSGTYVMTASEAAQAANTINPAVAIPMHYGAIVGSKEDALEFKRLARCRVEILMQEE
jgi:L-ascorbate metabolism protein UlaG (beta-lactamase superfamily)